MITTASNLHTNDAIQPRSGGNMRRLKVFLVYMLLGPPVGSMFAVVWIALYAIANFSFPEANLRDILSAIVFFPFAAALWSYFLGGAQAAATGLLLALFSQQGRFTYLEAGVIAAIPSFLGGFLVVEVMGGSAILLGAIGVLASLTLRRLFRGSFAPIAR